MMRLEFADERQLRATVAMLGVGDVTIHAVMPEYFLYSWPCGCKIVVDSARREWHACALHAQRDEARFRSA